MVGKGELGKMVNKKQNDNQIVLLSIYRAAADAPESQNPSPWSQ